MFEQTFKNIDDVLWKEAGCTTELDDTERTSWILFLKYLDDLEAEHALQAELHGKDQDKLGALIALKYGSAHEAVETLGAVPVIRDTFVGFQRYLYET